MFTGYVTNSFWTPCQTQTLSKGEFDAEDSASSNVDISDSPCPSNKRQ